MIELTDQQQAELASTGRVVVAVPCDPQPDAYDIIVVTGEKRYIWKDHVYFGETDMREHILADDWAFDIDERIPTPAGDAIVRDVDVRLKEVWEWVVTLELNER